MLDLFSEWLDLILSSISTEGIRAYNFNIYENEIEGMFDIQLVGALEYSDSNDDWACNTVYSSGENLFSITANDWERGLTVCVELVDEYLKYGKFAALLKCSYAVTAGFVDGDLEVIFKKGQ